MLSHFRPCGPVNCSSPGSSVRGILQARILGWVAVPSCRGPSRPRDQTCASGGSCSGRQVLSRSATWEAQRRAGLPLTSLSPSLVLNSLSLTVMVWEAACCWVSASWTTLESGRPLSALGSCSGLELQRWAQYVVDIQRSHPIHHTLSKLHCFLSRDGKV